MGVGRFVCKWCYLFRPDAYYFPQGVEGEWVPCKAVRKTERFAENDFPRSFVTFLLSVELYFSSLLDLLLK